MPDPDRVARIFGAWQLVEDAEGGPPYYWNTVTNVVQYKPPADPSAAPPASVHDVLLHSSAWKGW